MKTLTNILVLTLILGISTAQAKIYTYVDKSGDTKYVDRISAIPDQYKNQVMVATSTSIKSGNENNREIKRHSKKSRASQNNKDVEIYVTSWCGYCRKLEKFLNDNKIKFKKYDVEKNKKGRQEYSRLGKGGVPITKIGSRVIRGYKPDSIIRILE